MKKIFSLFATLFASLCVMASTSGTIDINGTQYPVDTLQKYQVGPGVVYTRFNVTIGKTVHNLYLLTADLTSPYLKVEEYQSKDQVGTTEALLPAAQKINSIGHRPIGGVNCNFWCVSGNISGPDSYYSGLLGVPFSGTAKDGVMIGNPSDWNNQGDRGTVMIDDMNRALIRNMKFQGRVLKAGLEEQDIRDCNRNSDNPSSDEISIYNRYIGTTRTIPATAIEVVFLPIEGQEWNINDTMTCTVVSRNHAGGTTLTGKQGALQGRGARGTWMNTNLQVGDTFRITLGAFSMSDTGDDNYSGDSIRPHIRQMVCGNCLVMANGNLTSRNTNEGYNNQNYPRTLLATNNEGTRFWMLVSQTPGNYTAEMCGIVKNDGATWAAGMDGGGSAQMLLLGKYPFISRDGTPRPTANSMFLISTAPEDSTVARLEFVDNLPTTISSYASYTPAIRAYNQYGVLLSSEFQDFTLTCDPASLGTISEDGHTFIASATAGTGTLTVTCGNITASKSLTVEAGEVSLALDSILIDTRDYPILAYSTADGKQLVVDPAYFTWTVDDPAVCEVTPAGNLHGLSNGETDIHGTLGSSTGSMHVTVEIPDAPILTATAFLDADTALWVLKNSSNPITWGVEDSVATLNFAVSSARSPQISLTGNLQLYSLPDSIELLLTSPVHMKMLSLIGYAHNSTDQVSATLTPDITIGEQTSLRMPIAAFDVDTADIAIWPFRLTKITFTLTDVKTNTPYVLRLHGLRLYYHNYTIIESALEDLPLSDDAARKVLLNGQLYIEKGGQRYDILGHEVR